MNNEINFKSPAHKRLLSAETRAGGSSVVLSCLLVLSLGSSGFMGAIAANPPAPAKPKHEKKTVIEPGCAGESKKDEKKEEKSDKKDEKSDKKDEKADKNGKPAEKVVTKPEPVIENVVPLANPEELVDKPHNYLGKNVKFTAPFCSFSNLALDYKPALRPSKTHLSLLVYRSKKSKIPLSELKLAMMTPPEKDPETTLLAGLKEGDMLEITGKVFSIALDDPWVDILRLKKLGGSTDDKKAEAAKAKINDTKSTESKGEKPSGGKSEGESKGPAK